VCGEGIALYAAPVGALLESLVGEVDGALVGALALEGAFGVGATGELSQGALECESWAFASVEFVVKGVGFCARERAALACGVLDAPTA